MEIAGRHVVITGAASGIGRALAERFAREGAAALTLCDLSESGVNAVAGSLGATGMRTDVSKEDEIRALVERANDAHGPIDIFVSNAGIGMPGGVELSTATWQRTWDVNVMAHIFAARAVLPQMIERAEGYLVSTASAAGLLAQIGSAPYSVTKHAAVALAEWIAIEHGAQGIRVSVICPQAVRTGMTAGSPTGGVAGLDGMIEPEAVAESTVQAIAEERFLVLPHPEVGEYVKRKASDVDRWLKGMQRLRGRFASGGFPPQES